MVRLIIALAAFAFAGATQAQNNPAAAGRIVPFGINGSFISLSAQENPSLICPRTIITGRVQITATLDQGGGRENFAVNAWDDGNFRTGIPFSVPVGQTGTFDFSIIYAFPILQGAAGVGVYLENAVGPAATTTFASNGSLQGTTTTACPAVGNGINPVGPVEIPAVAPAGLVLLAALLAFLGLRQRRR